MMVDTRLERYPKSTFYKPVDIPAQQQKPTPPSAGNEARPPYLRHEWAEEPGWYRRAQYNFLEVAEIRSITYPLTELELRSDPVR